MGTYSDNCLDAYFMTLQDNSDSSTCFFLPTSDSVLSEQMPQHVTGYIEVPDYVVFLPINHLRTERICVIYSIMFICSADHILRRINLMGICFTFHKCFSKNLASAILLINNQTIYMQYVIMAVLYNIVIKQYIFYISSNIYNIKYKAHYML